MTSFHPTHLDIDLSSKCNLRCSFCHLSYFTPKDISTQIGIELFDEKIAPLLPRLKTITLFSKYEVLTCRDFIPIFQRLREYEAEIYFSSNGILMSDKIIDAIVGHLQYLTISVTGFTQERYKKFMRSDKLGIVEENLTNLNKKKAELDTSYPRLRISTVGMQDTLEDIPAAIDFAKKHQASEGVQFTSLYIYEKSMQDQVPAANIKRYNHLTKKGLSYAVNRGIKLVLQSGNMDENTEATDEIGHRFCDLPWSRLSIQPNGDVYPCPVAYKPIGNFHKKSLQEIWDGDPMATFRLGVNNPENMNEDCRECIHCRHRVIGDTGKGDFSHKQEFVGGLKRKTPSPKRFGA